VVKRIQAELAGNLLFVFRNFPLAQVHPHALHAAYAAEAASLQGAFWEMHDSLFENQNALEDHDLVRYAANLGLDTEEFASDMGSEEVAQRVREDFMSGVRSGVNGTPTFFINGQRHDGSYAYDVLRAAIERTLVSSIL
jgi:protein-disulfide isomerase